MYIVVSQILHSVQDDRRSGSVREDGTPSFLPPHLFFPDMCADKPSFTL